MHLCRLGNHIIGAKFPNSMYEDLFIDIKILVSWIQLKGCYAKKHIKDCIEVASLFGAHNLIYVEFIDHFAISSKLGILDNYGYVYQYNKQRCMYFRSPILTQVSFNLI